jgi:hypothetical protein
VVVTEGVSANERVVLAGQMLVRPGSKVRLVNGLPPAPPVTANSNSKALKGEGQ